MVELADTPVLGTGGRNLVWVQIPLAVPYGALDELVESPAFHVGTCGFDPHTHHHVA